MILTCTLCGFNFLARTTSEDQNLCLACEGLKDRGDQATTAPNQGTTPALDPAKSAKTAIPGREDPVCPHCEKRMYRDQHGPVWYCGCK